MAHRVVDNKRLAVPWVEGPEEGLEIVPMPEDDVGQDSAERQVRRDQVQGIGRREVRRLQDADIIRIGNIKHSEKTYSECLVLHWVELAVSEEGRLVVLVAVLVLRKRTISGPRASKPCLWCVRRWPGS